MIELASLRDIHAKRAMPSAYERHIIVSYLANAAERIHYRDRTTAPPAEWLIDPNDRRGVASDRLRSRLRRVDIDPDEALSGYQPRNLRQALRDCVWPGASPAGACPNNTHDGASRLGG